MAKLVQIGTGGKVGHDISFGEVEDTINGRPVLVRRGREGTTEIYGASTAGRTLVVIVTPAVDGRWYVVTPREMTNQRAARVPPERTPTIMTTPEKLTELADYYDTTDLADNIEQATWEESDPVAEPMVTYALRLPKPVIDALRSAAASRGVKVSTLMREWLEERLAQADIHPDAAIPVSALLALVAERAISTTRAS